MDHPGPRIVLVRPKYAGNVGTTARAMGNMGLSDLRIVAPQYESDLDAFHKVASGRPVLEAARVEPDVATAVAGCTTIVACTARPRAWRAWKLLGPEDAAAILAARVAGGDDVAVLFGPEDHGLSTDDLDLATHICHVPTAPDMSSLNLAQAVLLVSWEYAKATTEVEGHHLRWRPVRRTRNRPRADIDQVNGAADQLGTLLDRIGFFRGRNRQQSLSTMRQALVRGEISNVEIHFLRGVINKLQWYVDHGPRLADPPPPDD